MLALAEYEAGLCPVCGSPRSVCTDPATEGHVSVPPPTRCHVETALSVARKPYSATDHNSALMFTYRVDRS